MNKVHKPHDLSLVTLTPLSDPPQKKTPCWQKKTDLVRTRRSVLTRSAYSLTGLPAYAGLPFVKSSDEARFSNGPRHSILIIEWSSDNGKLNLVHFYKCICQWVEMPLSGKSELRLSGSVAVSVTRPPRHTHIRKITLRYFAKEERQQHAHARSVFDVLLLRTPATSPSPSPAR